MSQGPASGHALTGAMQSPPLTASQSPTPTPSLQPGGKKRKRAYRSVESRAVAQKASQAMWADIEKGRNEYTKLIETISETHNRYVCRLTFTLIMG